MPADFLKGIAFWMVPRLGQFVLLVRTTCSWRCVCVCCV